MSFTYSSLTMDIGSTNVHLRTLLGCMFGPPVFGVCSDEVCTYIVLEVCIYIVLEVCIYMVLAVVCVELALFG